MGTPLVYSGNFASVYKVDVGRGPDKKSMAMRCFNQQVEDQEQRYDSLSRLLQFALPDSFVEFEYVDRGIRVRGGWYPVVLMGWAEGTTLNRFVEDSLNNPSALGRIAARWRGTISGIAGLMMAHDDLQHGNVMVQDNRLRLVDYDGIFLPNFRGKPSPELGHRNYHHPRRTADNYYDGIDNFPALVIYLSLLALRADPRLWQRFYNQDNLLFTREDYVNLAHSECFEAERGSHREEFGRCIGEVLFPAVTGHTCLGNRSAQ